MSYFNTNGEEGEYLMSSREKCAEQEGIALSLFRRLRVLSPSECWRQWHNTYGQAPPLTSVRRAITNMTNAGFLEKTSMRQTGVYGKKEYVWRYAVKQPVGQTELFGSPPAA